MFRYPSQDRLQYTQGEGDGEEEEEEAGEELEFVLTEEFKAFMAQSEAHRQERKLPLPLGFPSPALLRPYKLAEQWYTQRLPMLARRSPAQGRGRQELVQPQTQRQTVPQQPPWLTAHR